MCVVWNSEKFIVCPGTFLLDNALLVSDTKFQLSQAHEAHVCKITLETSFSACQEHCHGDTCACALWEYIMNQNLCPNPLANLLILWMSQLDLCAEKISFLLAPDECLDVVDSSFASFSKPVFSAVDSKGWHHIWAYTMTLALRVTAIDCRRSIVWIRQYILKSMFAWLPWPQWGSDWGAMAF